MKQLTKNFHRKEFDSKDGVKVPKELKCNLIKLAVNLQVIRDDLNKDNPKNDLEIVINSGYRTVSHNEKVGGTSNSKHLYAMAADLHQDKESPLEFYKRIEWLIAEGKVDNGGLGLYNSFVHYDIFLDGKARRWDER